VPILIAIFSVLFGLAFGSFLNVCITRLPRHESIVAPRSRCPRCGAPILSRDNLPLLSYLFLRGRCRNCRQRIPLRYPLIEAATAALFLLCLLVFGPTPHAAAAALLCWLLLGLAATDAETLLLPDALTLPGIALGVVASGLQPVAGRLLPSFSFPAAGESVLYSACAAAFILTIRWVYWLLRHREGIGLGDAKLLAMIAAWLGIWSTALALFLAVFGAAAYGLAIVALRKPPVAGKPADPGKIPPTRIPLGAFLSAAGIFVIFRGDLVLRWYLSFW
jgi:leader peptidase (prepilin peptidase)/N-methyltransferase